LERLSSRLLSKNVIHYGNNKAAYFPYIIEQFCNKFEALCSIVSNLINFDFFRRVRQNDMTAQNYRILHRMTQCLSQHNFQISHNRHI
jgi:hypothetical protein